MIIPVKCFTCGMVLADKYLYYVKMVRKLKLASHQKEEVIYFTGADDVQKTPEASVLQAENPAANEPHL